MNIKKHLLAILIILSPLYSYAKDITIAVSMSSFDDNFLTILRNAMTDEANNNQDIKLQIEDAKTDIAQQMQQVENFISQGADAIIVNPVDTKGVKPIMVMATNANIPLVFVNRKPEIPLLDNMAYVGSDSKLAGVLQMEELAKKMNGKGNLFVLMGTLSNEATRDRTLGVEEVVAKYPDIKIIDKQVAKFARKEAIDVVIDWVLTDSKIDAIVANNDEMAIGAIMALRQAKKENILVAGVDGTPDALEFIKKGDLAVTIFQDAYSQGKGALEAAVKMANNEPIEQNIWIPYQTITPENFQNFLDNNNK